MLARNNKQTIATHSICGLGVYDLAYNVTTFEIGSKRRLPATDATYVYCRRRFRTVRTEVRGERGLCTAHT